VRRQKRVEKYRLHKGDQVPGMEQSQENGSKTGKKAKKRTFGITQSLAFAEKEEFGKRKKTRNREKPISGDPKKKNIG